MAGLREHELEYVESPYVIADYLPTAFQIFKCVISTLPQGGAHKSSQYEIGGIDTIPTPPKIWCGLVDQYSSRNARKSSLNVSVISQCGV
jgi:hypothetical protein